MIFKSKNGLSTTAIICLVVLAFVLILLGAFGAQYFSDREINSSDKLVDEKTKAEISKIRSDTTGSLFWLKLVALFVTVGGAVGGYLIGQSRTTMAKINFEDRKIIDEVYQSIVQELADNSAILRAAAAVKLGAVLKSFPAEWNVGDDRKKQLLQLTKQVLAAALSIETDKKVLKTLTINIILDKPKHTGKEPVRANVQEIDLSGAQAEDAYWANCDFTNADFFEANLSKTSFKKSDLSNAQYRQAILKDAVFTEATCINTNFYMADLRGASFERAKLDSVNFDKAKVHSVSLKKANIKNPHDCQVDVSVDGDGSQMVPASQWLGTEQN